MLFKPNIVYPVDNIGDYITLDGEIVDVKQHLDFGFSAIKVKTTKGVFTGYLNFNPNLIPKVTYSATIKIYNCGGGFYPDNEIIAFGKKYK